MGAEGDPAGGGGAWAVPDPRRVVAPDAARAAGGRPETRYSAAPLWRAHRARQFVQLLGLRPSRLHHWRMRGDRRRQTPSRRIVRRRHARLDRRVLVRDSRAREDKQIMSAKTIVTS